ncbi:hypothetical protein JRQ81_011479 [Phrynocephalus forsythii]|uniref:Uncharacterized protein n=1 Tax=Phrynocephalus forsythii TaxID=171643 RepID=A0A9Q0X6A2_9SAUR|nr:hypothetical protein JRQ81_011479 [Phrynocephalus forsythii]
MMQGGCFPPSTAWLHPPRAHLSSLVSPVKADKKAAQEKMMQQEHERQEREDELRAMARKIRMKHSRSRSRSPHYRH